ncbi:hypothetical protein BDD12DRAFT_548755 [Trichophaea hybrida]|nr:hypothetical protein BDD12DRAFT_548755 [Trichophaea hybrida]
MDNLFWRYVVGVRGYISVPTLYKTIVLYTIIDVRLVSLPKEEAPTLAKGILLVYRLLNQIFITLICPHSRTLMSSRMIEDYSVSGHLADDPFTIEPHRTSE